MDNVTKAKEYALAHESEKRFSHTAGVAGDCGRLAEIFGLDDGLSESLVIAGWLHDTTKELSPSQQKELCIRYGVPEPEDGYGSPTLHAITAAYLTRTLFPDLVNETVFSAIRYHTTGKAGMSLSDMIVCFADYTEASRKYETCRRLRRRFYDNVTPQNRERLLCECLCEAFEATISSLTSRGDYIDPDTFDAKDSLLRLLENQEVRI